MSTQEKFCFALFALIVVSAMLFAIISYRRNEKILQQKSFYIGNQEKQQNSSKLSYWLPLFLYRRRRRTNGKKLAAVKHMRQL